MRRYGCSVETRYQTTGMGMHRIISLERLFSAILGTLTTRLACSHLRGWTGRIAVVTDIGQTALAVGDGKIRVDGDAAQPPTLRADMPQSRLTQLLFGVRDVEGLAMEPDVDIAPGALAVLRVLFPADNPHIWRNDRF